MDYKSEDTVSSNEWQVIMLNLFEKGELAFTIFSSLSLISSPAYSFNIL